VRPERTTEPVVRVVLAEAAAGPGPLHYLLEGEGFQILGCASNDDELMRLLMQSTQPEVIVVDAQVPATTAMVAREFAPDSELIVIWPESVAPPASADQVLPELVFQDLGPAVHRAADRNRLRRPVVEDADPIEDAAWLEPDVTEPTAMAAGRSAARVLVATVALIAAIVVTMGVSFALEGWRASHIATPERTPVVAPSTAARGGSSPAGSGQATHRPSGATNLRCVPGRGTGPNTHASKHAQQRASDCPAAGGANGTTRGTTHGSGTGTGSGQGSSHRSGDHGSAGAHGPGDHPSSPPATPASGDHAGPKG